MAFSLSDWYKSKFKGVTKDEASIKEAIAGIKGGVNAKGVLGFGSSAPLGWAETAERKLASGDLESAFSWITGEAQKHKAERAFNKYQKTQSKVERKLANEASNLANTLDFSNPLLTVAEKTSAQAAAAERQKKLDALRTQYSFFGDPSKIESRISRTSSGYIPTADLTRSQRQSAAAERQAAIERAAGIATNVAGGSQATAENTAAPTTVTATPTTIDNTIDARAFAETPTTTEVGGTPNLQTGTTSPVFVGEDGTSLYYIPAGSNQPTKISSPEQLQQLVASGVVAAGDQSTYQSLASADQFLASQTIGGEDSTGTGVYEGLQNQLDASLQPYRDAITSMQSSILGFEQSDYDALRESAENAYGIDEILDQLTTVDKQLADLLNIEDRVPETTLAAAQGTEVSQGVLDRQRANILGELARTAAPLSRLKSVLADDYDRRSALVDKAVDIQKEADSFKLQKLGYALDYAVSNFKMAQDQAQSIFDAATKDYEMRLEAIDKAASEKKASDKEYMKQLEDYYEAHGYILNPMTGEFEVKPVKGGGPGAGAISTDARRWVDQIVAGYATLKDVPASAQIDVRDALLRLGGASASSKGSSISKDSSLFDPETGAYLGYDASSYLGTTHGEKDNDFSMANNIIDAYPDSSYQDLYDTIRANTGWDKEETEEFLDDQGKKR